jgi:mRNA interferase RelE/StbE
VPYSVRLGAEAHAQLLALHPEVRQRLRRAIALLVTDPRYPGTRELQPPLLGWRLRVGHWRVLYLIDDAERQVLIKRIGPRAGFYD